MAYNGTDANDNIFGGYGDYYGGQGNDWLVGDTILDWLYGGQGNDVLLAIPEAIGTVTGNGTIGNPYNFDNARGVRSTETNWIDGGFGTDLLVAFDSSDVLYGGDGDDSGVFAAGPDNSIYFKAGLYGGTGEDVLYGGEGNDWLYGGTDADVLYGGRGNDVMYGGSAEDTIVSDGGIDAIYGGANNDLIIVLPSSLAPIEEYVVAEGGSGNDRMIGGSGADYLYGDSMTGGTEVGDDTLWGGGGNDFLIGGSGTDALLGVDGFDYMEGGAGGDYFNLMYDVQNGVYDYISDFSSASGDYVFLPYAVQGSTTFSSYGGLAYLAVETGPGTYYVAFAAGATSVADLQAHTLFA